MTMTMTMVMMLVVHGAEGGEEDARLVPRS